MSKHTSGQWRIQWGRDSSYPLGVFVWGRNIVTAFGCPSQEESCANARLIAMAPELLAEIEREYTELSDLQNEWHGRNTEAGQAKLCRLRGLIAKVTGRDEQDVQDDYSTRTRRAATDAGATP